MPSRLGRRRVHEPFKEWAQEHVFGADTLAPMAHAVPPNDNAEGGAGVERQHFAAGILAEEPEDELRREGDVFTLGKRGLHARRRPLCFLIRSFRQPVGPGGGVPAREARGQGVGLCGGEDDADGVHERKDGAG